ncbi:hypothetical protein [Flavobacterium rhizosphaerae]|uniref:Response regulator n=1 Tax=Flavobacterium rhizosphaerae TaxID=3163298 RepID=A0ABW8YYH2_9FLAO
MNKEGKIILIDSNIENSDHLSKCLNSMGHKNEISVFSDTDSAGKYIRDNIPDIFVVFQSTATPRIEVPDTRNMVYMHEKFNMDEIPYMFLINSAKGKAPMQVFVHCYYRSSDKILLSEILCDIALFWKDHIFPPKIQPSNG